MASSRRLEEARAAGEEEHARREEEEALRARRVEEQKQEEENDRIAARERAMAEVNSVQRTVHLDEQRELVDELMASYQREFDDKDEDDPYDFRF
jgi:hypothetical protein